jgi:nicotinate-nucleotide pyrophosphorylase (carboxylating)
MMPKPNVKIFSGPKVAKIVDEALEEDLGGQDVTTVLTVPAGQKAKARIVARQAGVAAGLPLLPLIWGRLDRKLAVHNRVREGGAFKAGACLVDLEGSCRAILSGERVALNFLQRLCGIATTTRAFADAIGGTRAVLLDTRKTTPNLRILEKYAVVCGGGVNHRSSLSEAVLIKDNHLLAAGGVRRAVSAAKHYAQGNVPVEVETENLTEIEEALEAGADIILLDNMSLGMLKQAVNLVAGRALTEASGGITLENVAAVAATGVDRISVGALTHSVRAVDLSLEIVKIFD